MSNLSDHGVSVLENWKTVNQKLREILRMAVPLCPRVMLLLGLEALLQI